MREEFTNKVFLFFVTLVLLTLLFGIFVLFIQPKTELCQSAKVVEKINSDNNTSFYTQDEKTYHIEQIFVNLDEYFRFNIGDEVMVCVSTGDYIEIKTRHLQR